MAVTAFSLGCTQAEALKPRLQPFPGMHWFQDYDERLSLLLGKNGLGHSKLNILVNTHYS